ncbi:MAG TPA: ornithine cyclodeaminase family protein [Chitinophagaceae bacterium]
MISSETILLTRTEVAGLLSIEEANAAVENSFRLYASGKAPAPGLLGVHAPEGGFHIKAGILNLGRNYFVSKTNANFPGNPQKNNLPTIQGVIIVSDADNGQLLALMDSIEITIIRTGAATAVAASYLSRINAITITICGCGNQGKISLRAIMKVRALEKAFVYDIDEKRAKQFASELANELNISIQPTNNLKEALRQSEICVTCTTSKKQFLNRDDLPPGIFIAAVGADSENKQELDPALLSNAKVVTDITSQCAQIGELHHALQAGMMKLTGVHAELGQIIIGEKTGRMNDDEIIVFDSTGTALQDIASAAIVYEKAIEKNIGIKLNFSK